MKNLCDYKIDKNIKDHDIKRNSFIDLAIKTFDLSFKQWYENGYWTDKYIPYTIFDGEKAVSNASANIIKTIVNGKAKTYIQIGTVMTDPDYQGQGLARKAIEEIISDYRFSDGIYLYANDTVLDFYPKFGFEKADEYSFKKDIISSENKFSRLDMNSPANIELLKSYYEKGNPFSDRPMLDNLGLIMFYCGSFMSDCVYYSKELDCIAVMTSFEDNVITCYDIFCGDKFSSDLDTVLSSLVPDDTDSVLFGFMPKDKTSCEIKKVPSDDNQLFVLSSKENMFKDEKMMLPLLSHA